MVAVFCDDDRGEQAGRAVAAVLQRVQQREDRRGEWMIAPDIFAPHDVAFEKVLRFVVGLLCDFLADAAPRLGARLHRLGIDHLIDHRQLRRPARAAPLFTLRRRWGRRAPWVLRRHGLRGV
ncbi:MAG: hypothetical protein ABIP85_04930 [Chthoniobacteraceae bacterium]